MTHPLLSVIVPLYNKEKYLRETLDSLLSQSFTDSEIIIINDGSTDRSLAIAQEYANKCDRIVLLTHENQGASFTRNKGIETAKGKYVIMVDSDDTIEVDMHKIMVSQAQLHNSDLVVCNFKTILKNGITQHKYNYPCDTLLNREYIEKEIIPNSIGLQNNANPLNAHTTLLIKRELLINNNIRYNNEHRKEEDKPFIMNCLKYAQSIVFVADYFYNYIKRPNSLISQYSPRFDNIVRNLTSYEELFKDICDFDNENYIQYFIRIFEENICYTIMHQKDVDNLKKEIMHIINHPKSRVMFLKSSDNSKLKEWYVTNKTFKIYRYYQIKFLKLHLKIFIRNILKGK